MEMFDIVGKSIKIAKNVEELAMCLIYNNQNAKLNVCWFSFQNYWYCDVPNMWEASITVFRKILNPPRFLVGTLFINFSECK